MFLIMTIEQVIHILRLHQKWRRGAISQPLTTQKEYGEALDELCLHVMLYTEKYSMTYIPVNMKMYDKDMKYVRGLMNKEEEKAYLDAEMKRAYNLFDKDKDIIEHYKKLADAKNTATKGA